MDCEMGENEEEVKKQNMHYSRYSDEWKAFFMGILIHANFFTTHTEFLRIPITSWLDLFRS